jgi:multicomponent Na+:H+ antiporter subunit G
MPVHDVLALLMVSVGVFFMFVASVGIIRLPDFYTRIHAMGKGDTFGIMLILLGLCVHEGFTLVSAKLVLALVFVGVTNPVASHALARAALRQGLKPLFTFTHGKKEGGTTKNAVEA